MNDLLAALHSRIYDLDRITARCNAGRTISCPECGGELDIDAPPPTILDGHESPVTFECFGCGWLETNHGL